LASNKEQRIIQDWLDFSASDLKCANLLFENKMFSQAIYYLQQSNEKLAKALLLKMGFLTPKAAKKDLRVKEFLGFLPKQPSAYRHRTMPSFIADVEKSIPSVENLFTFIESSELGPRIQEYHALIRKSKKGVLKLKKKPFSPVVNAEQLSKEVLAAVAILGAIDKTERKMRQEIAKLDLQEVYLAAKNLFKREGFNVEGLEKPDFETVKEGVVQVFKLSVLTTISVALASLLDPLEGVTRYPDSRNASFDEQNAYVLNFKGLSKVVACISEAGTKLL
jgi:hypothetical protein